MIDEAELCSPYRKAAHCELGKLSQAAHLGSIARLGEGDRALHMNERSARGRTSEHGIARACGKSLGPTPGPERHAAIDLAAQVPQSYKFPCKSPSRVAVDRLNRRGATYPECFAEP